MITMYDFQLKYSDLEFTYQGIDYRVFDWYKNDAGELLITLLRGENNTILINIPFNTFAEAANIAQFRYIKEWYLKAYPGDEYGEHINDKITFADLITAMYFREDCYRVLNVYDSVIRERVFEKCAELFDKPYNDIYELWLGDPENKQRLSDYGLKADIC